MRSFFFPDFQDSLLCNCGGGDGACDTGPAPCLLDINTPRSLYLTGKLSLFKLLKQRLVGFPCKRLG